MKLVFLVLGLSLLTPVFAEEDPTPKEPRTLGNTAVMHVYYYAPKSLEVTYVDSYLFKDESACKDAIPKALQIATVYASDGDLVSASCVGMTPPAIITAPPKNPPASGATEL